MVKYKVSDLEGWRLDVALARALGYEFVGIDDPPACLVGAVGQSVAFSHAQDTRVLAEVLQSYQGFRSLTKDDSRGGWVARFDAPPGFGEAFDPRINIALFRAFVSAKLKVDEVEFTR